MQVRVEEGNVGFSLANNGGVVDLGNYVYGLASCTNETATEWYLSNQTPDEPVPEEPDQPDVPVDPDEPGGDAGGGARRMKTVNWNLDIGSAARKKRRTYPTKTTMNLYFRENRGTKPATILLYVLFVLVLLLAAGKFLVLDRVLAVDALEDEAVRMESQTASVMARLGEYPAVLEEYTRLAPTEREQALTDRMDVLDLIDEVIRPAAHISRVTIQDQQVLVEFSGVTLVETADIVSRLEASPLVARTTVDTAASEEDRATVDVDMLIELSGGEEAAQE